MKVSFIIKIIALIIICNSLNFSFAENRMKKSSFSEEKKKLTDENVGTNITFYKTMAKDIASNYRIKGRQMMKGNGLNTAGSTVISSGSHSTNIVINENYGNINNIAVQLDDMNMK